jgi:transposase
MMRYVGIDVGKARCRAALMNQKGAIESEFFFENNTRGISNLVSVLTGKDQVVMEFTGNLWLNIYDALDHKNIRVVLANPMKTKAIASARVKTDKVDARILAHLLRADLVAASYVPPVNLREMRALVRHRLSLVKMRTMVKNKVHAVTDKCGCRCEYSDMFGKAGMEWLRTLEMGELDRLVLENHLSHIESINAQISRVDEAIRKRASQDEDVRLLLSMTGIDVYTALLIRSEVGPISRFSDYKKLVSWAGLAPRVYQSGNVEYGGAITKRGSSVLRWAMIEAARVAVQHDEKLGAFYQRVRERRGDQKATVATANKMLKIIWVMLTRHETYGNANEKRYWKKLKKGLALNGRCWLQERNGSLVEELASFMRENVLLTFIAEELS